MLIDQCQPCDKSTLNCAGKSPSSAKLFESGQRTKWFPSATSQVIKTITKATTTDLVGCWSNKDPEKNEH